MTENNIKYKKGTPGWLKGQAKKDGFDNIRIWQNWKRDHKNTCNLNRIVNNINSLNSDEVIGLPSTK